MLRLRAIASNRFSGSQRFGTDYFSVEAQCVAPLRHPMTFIELDENLDAFALCCACCAQESATLQTLHVRYNLVWIKER
jgi:hypothetical protein